MRFQLQTGTEEGLSLAPPELQPHVSALQTSPSAWDELPRETQAVGLTLGSQHETRAYLEALAVNEPARALDVALRSMQYSLSFMRFGTRIVRVLQRTGPVATAALLHADFWRQLRRVSWEDPQLQAELAQVADAHAPTDLRLRAGLAYVFPDERRWWTTEDRARALRTTDAETGALMLLALSRNLPQSRLYLAWPPPASTLGWLDGDAFVVASHWCRKGGEAAADPWTIAQALRNASAPENRDLLVGIVPTKDLLRRAKRHVRPVNAADVFVRDVLLDLWAQELEAPGTYLALQERSGALCTNAREHARIMSVMAGREPTALDALRQRFSPESLSRFVESLFVRWLLEHTPTEGMWTVRALAEFPSDRSAEALAELARNVRNVKMLELLATFGTRRALQCLVQLAAEAEEHEWPSQQEVGVILDQAAQSQGMPRDELLDRLVPPLELPPHTTISVEPRGELRLHRSRRATGEPPDLDAHRDALPAVLRRLEERMAFGEPMSALHFTECWGLHPLLEAVAERLVWGVFENGARLRWFIPGNAVELSEDQGVRPLHPLELTQFEREEAGRLIDPRRQPFEQLTRPIFDRDTPLSQEPLFNAQGFVHVLLERGWKRAGPREPSYRRTLHGLEAQLVLEPVQYDVWRMLRLVTWGHDTPRAHSELRLEIVKALYLADD